MNRIRIPISDPDLTGYLGEMQEFLAAVAEDREPASAGTVGRRDLELVLRSYEALTAGTWLDVPED
jgi:predicted dehydrogenase